MQGNSLSQEFKKFVARGNVMDLAIGIIIGGAFGGIVKSLVDDILMPPIGMLVGYVDFANLFVVLREGAKQPGPYATLEAAKAAGAQTWRYGLFINALVNFLIVAMAVFLLIKLINRMLPKEEPKPAPSTKTCPYCQMAVPPKAVRCPYCTSELPAG